MNITRGEVFFSISCVVLYNSRDFSLLAVQSTECTKDHIKSGSELTTFLAPSKAGTTNATLSPVSFLVSL